MDTKKLIEMNNITKCFGSVKALDNVSFNVFPNEIHAICGENGAGKSTLMNILSGVYPYGTYEGELFYKNRLCRFKNIKDSEKCKVAIIHQHFALIPALSIAENIYIGHENQRKGIIDWHETRKKSMEYMRQVGLKINPDTLVRDIGVGQQQLVEICKALSKNVELLILDEPTAALNDDESKILLNLLLEFKNKGISSVLISHKINEITMVADRVTILRDGKVISTLKQGIDDTSENYIIRGMVGREMKSRFPKRAAEIGDVKFKVRDWTVYDPTDDFKKKIKNVNISVRAGEVLGLAGIMGAGRTEFAMSIFGRSYGVNISGRVFLDDHEITLNNVSDAIKQGIGYVSEDRHEYGFIGNQSIKNNMTLPSLKQFTKNLSIDQNKEIIASKEYKSKLRIKATSVAQQMKDLSGGNQQKVIFSKWALSGSRILILDEPTRGIDVGSKYEIYELINEIASRGNSIILISSDMTELVGMCDRVYVMNDGRIVGELENSDITQENIMRCIIKNKEMNEHAS